ncbi:MAG: hypothetical protein LBD59_05915 [Prevotellaceae bacterium]|jgi:hypothetical protein|nr:hypothetical protein [Prevotellaceae bacterium]
MNEKNRQQKLPDDERAVFIPEEDIRTIEHTLNRLEEAKQGFRRSKIESGYVDAKQQSGTDGCPQLIQ